MSFKVTGNGNLQVPQNNPINNPPSDTTFLYADETSGDIFQRKTDGTTSSLVASNAPYSFIDKGVLDNPVLQLDLPLASLADANTVRIIHHIKMMLPTNHIYARLDNNSSAIYVGNPWQGTWGAYVNMGAIILYNSSLTNDTYAHTTEISYYNIGTGKKPHVTLRTTSAAAAYNYVYTVNNASLSYATNANYYNGIAGHHIPVDTHWYIFKEQAV